MSSSVPALSRTASSSKPVTAQDDRLSSHFRAPKFIRILFDTFPLYTYPVDPLPMTAREMQMSTTELQTGQSSSTNTLYVFNLPQDAEDGAPSFNPTCLKWQVRGILNTLFVWL